MDSGALRALLTPEGLRLLDDVTERLDSLGDAMRAVAALRREGHPADLVAAVLTQARLRRRARAKFGEFASRMLFTEAGLEQATRLRVAAVHAGRFRDADIRSVADLGCGIGGDALAFATLGVDVTAVERDEVTAAIAGFNLAPWPEATVLHAAAEDVDLAAIEAVWADPARRDAKGKRLPPERWSPTFPRVLELAGRRPAGVKVSPAIDHDLLPDDAETQWVSVDNETVEAVVWTGALARDGARRSALVMGERGAAELSGGLDEPDPGLRELGAWIAEPAGAVIRARLLGQLAAGLDAGLVSERIAYLTSDAMPESVFVQRFRVLETMPLDVRAISRTLRERGIGTLEIKKRGADVDPERLRKQLRLSGDGAATLFATRVAGRHRAILAERA